MATELGLLSLTHLHKLAQSQDNQNQDQNQDQINPNIAINNTSTTSSNITTTSTSATTTIGTTCTDIASRMWNPKPHQAEEDDSWEVRAFAEDTGNVMGMTWPPRSYTCAFCRREFRSAQALGGHMNVHRRDRARLHQVIPPNSIINHPSAAATAAVAAAAAATSSSTPTSSSFLIPTGEFVAGGGGLCLLYQLPNPNGAYGCSDSPSPSTLPSVSSYPPHNLLRPPFSPSVNIQPGGDNNARRSRHDQYHPNRAEEALESAENGGDEELDLELRLGHGPTPS